MKEFLARNEAGLPVGGELGVSTVYEDSRAAMLISLWRRCTTRPWTRVERRPESNLEEMLPRNEAAYLAAMLRWQRLMVLIEDGWKYCLPPRETRTGR